MHCFLTTTLFLLSFLAPASAFGNSNRAPSKNAILLSNVQTLTLHSGRQTSNRRVSSIPQLQCVGPSRKICSLHTIDVMQCTNQGYDYDEEDVQWSCHASLPAEFKLGGTEVICEGYRDPDDKWVLKGSCGVEYRLLLTDVGEQRYGRIEGDSSGGISWVASVIILAVLAFILVKACSGARAGEGRGRGWGGGGGDGGGNPPYDPPPPYDPWRSSGSGMGSSGPGFWSGAALGGAGGYGLGRRYGGTRSSNGDPWVGSSGSGSRHQSTGFGSTRRR